MPVLPPSPPNPFYSVTKQISSAVADFTRKNCDLLAEPMVKLITVKIKRSWIEPVRTVSVLIICDAAKKGTFPTAFFSLLGKGKNASGKVVLPKNETPGKARTYLYNPMTTGILSRVPSKSLNERMGLKPLGGIMTPGCPSGSGNLKGLLGGPIRPELCAQGIGKLTTAEDATSLMNRLRSMQPKAVGTEVLTIGK
jgi:hypothetical protein